MNNAADPRQTLDQSGMTIAQVVVVAITVLLNAMDGYDILSIAIAASSIAREWGIDRAALGIVLSMELIGMAIGSVLLGGAADKVGRRPVLLGCLLIMAAGMFLATTATSPQQLSVWRVITGLGIGGMLSCTNATVAEVANKKWRGLCISLMVIGYPLGGTIGGLYAGELLETYSWHSAFYLGAIATALLIPLVYFLVPESVHWLARKQPDNALDRINAALTKLGHAAISALPAVAEDDRKKSVWDIFSPALLRTTVLVTLAYFLNVTTLYFGLKWAGFIVDEMMGFTAADGARMLAIANFGGALGGAVFGLLTHRIGLKPLTIAVLVGAMIAVSAFGRTGPDLGQIALLIAMAGFFTNAAIAGMYSLAAYCFPTHVRATGTGFVIGVGRAGAVLSPIIVGFLFAADYSLPVVAMIMGSFSLLAAILLMFLKMNTGRSADVPATE